LFVVTGQTQWRSPAPESKNWQFYPTYFPAGNSYQKVYRIHHQWTIRKQNLIRCSLSPTGKAWISFTISKVLEANLADLHLKQKLSK